MENCKNCKYVEEIGSYDCTFYNCAITGASINFPRFTGGSKKCVCYRRAEKKKDKFVYPMLDDLENYLQKIDKNQNDLF